MVFGRATCQMLPCMEGSCCVIASACEAEQGERFLDSVPVKVIRSRCAEH